jgi:hypothetical protein
MDYGKGLLTVSAGISFFAAAGCDSEAFSYFWIYLLLFATG